MKPFFRPNFFSSYGFNFMMALIISPTLESGVSIDSKHFQETIGFCAAGEGVANHNVLHVKQPEGESFMIISVEDWEDIEETLFLSRIPGFAETVHEAYQLMAFQLKNERADGMLDVKRAVSV